MSEGVVGSVWEVLAERVGDDLRSVARYEATDVTSRMRDDVESLYSVPERQELIDSVILNQMHLDVVDDAFKTGDLNALVQVFDDAWVIAHPDSLQGKSGVLVSIDRPGSETTMADIDWVCTYLADELDGLLE
ncbi:MAG: hypothetical protein ABEJ30_05695 [Halorientalis sp.]